MLIDLSRVRVSGPLSAFATGFADHMTRQGYSQQQARIQLLLLNRLSNWLVSKGLDVGELRAKEVEQFQLSRHEAGDKILRSISAMQPILGYPNRTSSRQDAVGRKSIMLRDRGPAAGRVSAGTSSGRTASADGSRRRRSHRSATGPSSGLHGAIAIVRAGP
jgi:hypothetical protein